MARGEISMASVDVYKTEILNRKEFEAVPMTLDFTDWDGDTEYIPAGMPIDIDGVPVKAAPWTNVVGINLHDVYPDYPQAAVLKKAYINNSAVGAVTYDKALVTALQKAQCRIVIENPVILAE